MLPPSGGIPAGLPGRIGEPMSKELSTLVKTGVVQIGWPRLYEAQSFKADKNGKPDLVQEFDENALLDDADRRHADSINDALKNYDAAEDDPKRPELDMDALEDVSNPAHLKNAMLLLKYVKSHFSTTVAGKPSYSLTVLFDKDDPSQARNIKMLREGQSNAMKNAVAKKTWMKATIQTASRAMQDCDTDVQTYGTGDNAKQMTAAQKYPERANHWYLNAKAKRRPDIYYLSEANKFVKLPDPILMPESDEEREQALQIEELWNKWVYPGQNAMLGVTFKAWTSPAGAGVSCRLEAVFIIGGGVRLGGYSFGEIFGDEDLQAAAEWLKKNAPDFDPETGKVGHAEPAMMDDDEDSEVDETTGEITDPELAPAPEPKPVKKRRTTRAKKQLAPAPEPEPAVPETPDTEDADGDDGEDGEDVIW